MRILIEIQTGQNRGSTTARPAEPECRARLRTTTGNTGTGRDSFEGDADAAGDALAEQAPALDAGVCREHASIAPLAKHAQPDGHSAKSTGP